MPIIMGKIIKSEDSDSEENSEEEEVNEDHAEFMKLTMDKSNE